MTRNETIVSALHDAIGWQISLMDAYDHMRDDPAYADAKRMVKRYRAFLKRVTGSTRTRLEKNTKDLKSETIWPWPGRKYTF